MKFVIQSQVVLDRVRAINVVPAGDSFVSNGIDHVHSEPLNVVVDRDHSQILYAHGSEEPVA
jgi:hypothetical protein